MIKKILSIVFILVLTFSYANAQVTKMANTIKVPAPAVTVDTTIRVAPTWAYLSIDMQKIEGTRMEEVLGGKESFWVFDKTGKEIKVDQKLLKKVNGAMEGGIVNYLVKIPFRLKTDANPYTVRFRWESNDGKKIIDITANGTTTTGSMAMLGK
jgi:hypothetical protein